MNKATPAVRDILDALVGEQMLGTRKVSDPARIIARKFEVTPSTARKYLKRAEDAQLVTLSHMGGSISHLFLQSEEDIALKLAALETPPVAPKPLPAEAPPPPEPRLRKAKPVPIPGPDATAVLVDVENVIRDFESRGTTVSFGKLKNHLRSLLGTIGFCDAFVSPRVDQRTIAILWDAGFEVIACPMGSKDKDAVDEKIRTRALKYLLTTGIRRVAIVSRDADFKPLVSEAADRGREVMLVNLASVQKDLAGTDEKAVAPYSRPVQRFLDAAERVRQRTSAAERDSDRGFVTHVASLVRLDFQVKQPDRQMKAISHRIRPRLLAKWSPSYLLQDVDAAVRALLEGGALRRNGPSGLKLHQPDPLWKHIP